MPAGVFARCLAGAEMRMATHYEREAAATRRQMNARGEETALIEARCQPDWWQDPALWDERIFDGDTEPRIHSYGEQDAIRGLYEAARRAAYRQAQLGRYRVRLYRPSSRHDMSPVMHWTVWQWKKKLKPQPQLISDVERFLQAERSLWTLHDQYDPHGTRIAIMEAERREDREWQRRRASVLEASLAQLELPWAKLMAVATLVPAEA